MRTFQDWKASQNKTTGPRQNIAASYNKDVN